MKLKIAVRSLAIGLAALNFLTLTIAQAAEPVLAEAGSAKVTTIDVQGDALRIPLEVRTANLHKPETVLQLTNNLIIRRALAAKAHAEGLDKDPAIQAAIRIARDRVLSDALFAKMDAANKPSTQAVDKLAQANYKSNPTRFERPAETSARHILIKAETPDAKAKAEKILAQLKGGADFATVAREVSEDPGSATAGGELGYQPKGAMVAPFEAAVAKLEKPGDLSEPVETQFGYHIIKLEGRRPAGIRSYDEVKVVLRREVEAKALNDARLAEVQKIQDTVKMNKDAINAFAESQK